MITDETTNVLIVDDLPEKLLVYRTILEQLHLNLVTAGSGEEALRAVLHHDFAVILLDVRMPGMDGFETAAMIRRRKRSAHIPIIFLTAFADEVRAAEGYAQGAVDYITTPVIPAVLLAKVRVFADLHRMTQQVRRQAEERIALVEERTKREAAEEANRWLDFLTRAGAVLGQSLDLRIAMQSVVRLTIPVLADEAVLIIPSCQSTADGGRRKADVGTRKDEPSSASTRPPSTPLPGTCLRAQREPEGTLLEEDVDPRTLDRDVLAAAEAARTGQEFATGHIIAFPLQARGHMLATLALIRRTSRRPFVSGEMTVAEMFASRASSALENARLYRELQEADRQKNEFLSMLAHELRNPLAPIRNANEVLRQRAAETNKVRWAQGVIERQLTHLVRLVDDLLDVSRLTLGKIRLTLDRVALEGVVANAVEATQPLISQFQHALEVSLPPHPVCVMGDEARLTQVVTNLLNNAAKYTEPGGKIWLSAELEDGVAVLRVRDSGVGIAADLLPRVFDLFTQANRSLDRSQGGLGIGLTLVRQLVEMQGGTVEARSEGQGRGSEFVVRLPALADEPDPAANGRPKHAGAGRGPGLRIVVVDDSIDAAETLAELVGLLGPEVTTAHDGPSALVAVRDRAPDAVFLDIGLPGMNGYDVARHIRLERGSGIVLVAVSGYGRDEDHRQSREAGFNHHLVKPVHGEALKSLLESIRSASCV